MRTVTVPNLSSIFSQLGLVKVNTASEKTLLYGEQDPLDLISYGGLEEQSS
jgi:hypothetical protein